MTNDLVWMPVYQGCLKTAGWYWFRNFQDYEWIARIDPWQLENWMYSEVMSYCPVPSPREPRRLDRSQQLALPFEGQSLTIDDVIECLAEKAQKQREATEKALKEGRKGQGPFGLTATSG